MLLSSSPIARSIRSLREKANLTREEFAHALDIKVAGIIVGLEAGTSMPSDRANKALQEFAQQRGEIFETLSD